MLFIAFYTLVTLIVGAGVYLFGDDLLRDQMEDRIEAESAYLFVAYERGGVPLLQTVLQARDDRGVNALGYLLVDRDGHRIGGELRTTPPAPGWSEISFTDGNDDLHTARALTHVLSDGSRLTVAVEMAPSEELLHITIGILVSGMLIVLAGGILGTILVTRFMRGRLDSMNRTAHAIIAGDMTQRVPEDGADDEFRQLAVTFNRMLDKNSDLIASLRQVSSGIAHDLRTPISRLRRRLENARNLSEGGQDNTHEIEASIGQTDDILALFASLLRIAEVESGALREYFGPVDLSDTAGLIGEIYTPVAEDCGRELTIAVEPGLSIRGDRELILQALINLLENAFRHTPPGTTVNLRLARHGDKAALTVSDDGPGVPESQLPSLTSRFSRGSRHRASPGYGLGLNSVKAIALAHEADLTIRNGSPGLVVRLDFALI